MSDPPSIPGPDLLRQYLAEHGLSQADFAACLRPPTDPRTVSRWTHRERVPAARRRTEIALLTRGVVPAGSWLSETQNAREAWLASRSRPDGER